MKYTTFPTQRRINASTLAPAMSLLLFCLTLLCPALVQAQQRQQQQRGIGLNKQPPAQTKAGAQPRTALVIGNGDYQNAPRLANPVNDAGDMSTMLRGLGFEVIGGTNLGADQMKKFIRQFGEKLAQKGGVGLFYYAGHGLQSQGHNYLMPVEANLLREQTLEFDAVDVNRVLAEMDAAGNGFNVVILDACRNNPFARSWRSGSDGLAQMNAATGTFIAYATAPGRVAGDGRGRNGTYTAELLKQMKAPGLSIEETFKRVREGVMTATKNQQVPWESSSLVGSFYFVPGAGGASSLASAAQQQMQPSQPDSSPMTTSAPVETASSARFNNPAPASRRSSVNLSLIESNFQSNLLDDVVKDAIVFLDENPQHPRASWLLGSSLFRKGMYREAMPYLESAYRSGEIVSFPAKRRREFLLDENLTDGQLTLVPGGIEMQYGGDAYTMRFADIQTLEARTDALGRVQLYMKGTMLTKSRKQERKDFNLFAPTANVQRVPVGNGTRNVIFCQSCEVWVAEVVKFINRCKTNEAAQSSNDSGAAAATTSAAPSNLSRSAATTTATAAAPPSQRPAVIAPPSTNYRPYAIGKLLQLNVPDNWRDYPNGASVILAPEGAYASDGVSHGVMIFSAQTRSRTLRTATEEYVQAFLGTSGNSYLSRQGGAVMSQLGGREALTIAFSGLSPATNKVEAVRLYTTILRDGKILVLLTVSPQDESPLYAKAFLDLITSLRITD